MGYQKVSGSVQVAVGDSIMVGPNGGAQVRLDDGNVITLSAGQVFNVPAKASAADAMLPSNAHPTQGVPDNTNPYYIVGGIALVAGGVTAAVLLTQNNNSPAPASP